MNNLNLDESRHEGMLDDGDIILDESRRGGDRSRAFGISTVRRSFQVRIFRTWKNSTKSTFAQRYSTRQMSRNGASDRGCAGIKAA
jgi:hypothetical protein